MKLNISISKKESGDITREVVSEKDVGPYIVRKEIWYHFSAPEGTEMESAYTHNGDYIGNSDDAKRLYAKFGIIPEIAQKGHSVCSIGKSDKDGKWYGWSHRAIYGFKIGDKVEKGDCGFKGTEYTIKTEADAKQAAKDFAESISSGVETMKLSVVLAAGKALVSLSLSHPSDRKALVDTLAHLGCKPKKLATLYSDSYQCTNWDMSLIEKIEEIGWEYTDSKNRVSHIFVKNNEVMAIIPEGGKTFLLEFPV